MEKDRTKSKTSGGILRESPRVMDGLRTVHMMKLRLREIGLRKLIGKERRDFDAQTRCLQSRKDDIHGSDPK